jgi:hypothetical protein
MILSKYNYTTSALLLLFLNCGPATSGNCGFSENISDWKIVTNQKVLGTDLIYDQCKRNIGVTSTLDSGGEIKLIKEFVPNIKEEETATLEVNAGTSGTCTDISISFNGVTQEGISGRFLVNAKNQRVEILVKTQNKCFTSIKPTL